MIEFVYVAYEAEKWINRLNAIDRYENGNYSLTTTRIVRCLILLLKSEATTEVGSMVRDYSLFHNKLYRIEGALNTRTAQPEAKK